MLKIGEFAWRESSDSWWRRSETKRPPSFFKNSEVLAWSPTSPDVGRSQRLRNPGKAFAYSENGEQRIEKSKRGKKRRGRSPGFRTPSP